MQRFFAERRQRALVSAAHMLALAAANEPGGRLPDWSRLLLQRALSIPGVYNACVKTTSAAFSAYCQPPFSALGCALSDALLARDGQMALTLARMLSAGPDLATERLVSYRYRWLWLSVPKAASRSLIRTLRHADPESELFKTHTVRDMYRAMPELRDYFSFAFIRHPVGRAVSCFRFLSSLDAGSEFGRAMRAILQRRGRVYDHLDCFSSFCRFLDSPLGADAVADRHWLSQHVQIRLPDNRLPDFIGRIETLDADWRALAERIRMTLPPLPKINESSGKQVVVARRDAELLRRRYAEDWRIGGYGGT